LPASAPPAENSFLHIAGLAMNFRQAVPRGAIFWLPGHHFLQTATGLAGLPCQEKPPPQIEPGHGQAFIRLHGPPIAIHGRAQGAILLVKNPKIVPRHSMCGIRREGFLQVTHSLTGLPLSGEPEATLVDVIPGVGTLPVSRLNKTRSPGSQLIRAHTACMMNGCGQGAGQQPAAVKI
jgi:hypothetical protein